MKHKTQGQQGAPDLSSVQQQQPLILKELTFLEGLAEAYYFHAWKLEASIVGLCIAQTPEQENTQTHLYRYHLTVAHLKLSLRAGSLPALFACQQGGAWQETLYYASISQRWTFTGIQPRMCECPPSEDGWEDRDYEQDSYNVLRCMKCGGCLDEAIPGKNHA